MTGTGTNRDAFREKTLLRFLKEKSPLIEGIEMFKDRHNPTTEIVILILNVDGDRAYGKIQTNTSRIFEESTRFDSGFKAEKVAKQVRALRDRNLWSRQFLEEQFRLQDEVENKTLRTGDMIFKREIVKEMLERTETAYEAFLKLTLQLDINEPLPKDFRKN